MCELVAGHYAILKQAGEGGVALVYQARDTLTGRTVALKLLREQYTTDPTFVARFQNEAQAIKGLVHPHIVRVYDHGLTGPGGVAGRGTLYIAMQYVDGPTLKAYIKQCGRIGVREALDIMRQILQGLAAAHAHGIIHRDIKPQNVLLDRNRQALIGDFGIAKTATTPALTQYGMTIGTAEYMAPEQAQGLIAGPPADIYSTGLVLYEMLTGSLPFTGKSPVEVAMKQVTQAPQAPSEIVPAIPPALEAIVLRALDKQPEQRFQTAAEMIAALDRLAGEIDYATIPPAQSRPAALTAALPVAPAISTAGAARTMTIRPHVQFNLPARSSLLPATTRPGLPVLLGTLFLICGLLALVTFAATRTDSPHTGNTGPNITPIVQSGSNGEYNVPTPTLSLPTKIATPLPQVPAVATALPVPTATPLPAAPAAQQPAAPPPAPAPPSNNKQENKQDNNNKPENNKPEKQKDKGHGSHH